MKTATTREYFGWMVSTIGNGMEITTAKRHSGHITTCARAARIEEKTECTVISWDFGAPARHIDHGTGTATRKTIERYHAAALAELGIAKDARA